MYSDQPHQRTEEELALVQGNETKALRPIYFLPFDVQLQNTLIVS